MEIRVAVKRSKDTGSGWLTVEVEASQEGTTVDAQAVTAELRASVDAQLEEWLADVRNGQQEQWDVTLDDTPEVPFERSSQLPHTQHDNGDTPPAAANGMHLGLVQWKPKNDEVQAGMTYVVEVSSYKVRDSKVHFSHPDSKYPKADQWLTTPDGDPHPKMAELFGNWQPKEEGQWNESRFLKMWVNDKKRRFIVAVGTTPDQFDE